MKKLLLAIALFWLLPAQADVLINQPNGTFAVISASPQGASPTTPQTVNVICPTCSGSGGSPGGSTTQVQYNNAGSFGGASGVSINGGVALNVTANGALSSGTGPAVYGSGTWVTGGSATTTKPYFLVEPAGTTSTAWNTSGTGFGINAPNGFSGALFDFQVNGTSFLMQDQFANLYGLGAIVSGGTGAPKTALSTTCCGGGGGIVAANNLPIGWTSTGSAFGTMDTALGRNAAGVVEINNGTLGTLAGLKLSAITATGLATDATHTDNTVCVDSSTGVFYRGSGALGICLGTSSARYKHDIAPLGSSLAQIVTLKPSTFFYNVGYGDDGARRQNGFIAEDVAGVAPELVALDADGRPNSVDMVAMVPMLVKAMQQQQVVIDCLRAGKSGC